MTVNQALELAPSSESNSIRAGQYDNRESHFDGGQLLLAKAELPGGRHDQTISEHASHKLPHVEINLPDADHGGPHSKSEDLIDDIRTLTHNDSNVNVRSGQASRLVKDKNDWNDLPVVHSDDIPEGKIGILISKNSKGEVHYTPFVSAPHDGTARPNAQGPVGINISAAKELQIDKDLKKGITPKIDMIVLPDDTASPRAVPHSKDDLQGMVLEKIHSLAEAVRDKQAAERQAAEASLPDAPAPDPEFGYRRTDRTPEELRKIQENFRTLARESQRLSEPEGLQENMKAFQKQVQKDIDKYQAEVNKGVVELARIKREDEQLKAKADKAPDGTNEQKLVADRALVVAAKMKASEEALQTSQYNLSYAQSEAKLAKNPESFSRHMQARARAAAIMSQNPDMDTALTGHRVVVNAGHYPEDPQFPGFEKDDTAEWKLNLESEDVAGAMIKMAGGAVKLINQADLKVKTMSGLANAIKAAKPEAAIAIHHDDGENPDSPAMRGTLTLQCAKTTGEDTLELAKAVHMAKLNYADLDDRTNAKGVSVGIREQCGRGVQGRNVDAPFILDEQMSTHKDEWPLARDAKTNAMIQFSHVASLYEFLNDKPRYKTSPDIAKQWHDKVWSKTDMDDVWKKQPKVGAWKK